MALSFKLLKLNNCRTHAPKYEDENFMVFEIYYTVNNLDFEKD